MPSISLKTDKKDYIHIYILQNCNTHNYTYILYTKVYKIYRIEYLTFKIKEISILINVIYSYKSQFTTTKRHIS